MTPKKHEPIQNSSKTCLYYVQPELPQLYHTLKGPVLLIAVSHSLENLSLRF